jgi:hypothetical protein
MKLTKLATGVAVALVGLLAIADSVSAQPPPGWGTPGFGIYIGPPVRRYPPPPPMYGLPPPPPMYGLPPPPPMDYRRGPRYCDVRACAATYRSFDPRSCTYQPFYGPRQYCTVRW